MPRAGLSRDAVVALAVELVDADPTAPLTLAAVASRAGVAVPSLYKHVASLDALRDAVALVGIVALTDAVRAATTDSAGATAMHRAGRAIRDYARRHPGLYAASQPAPGREASPELAAAAADAVAAVALVIAQAGLGPERTVDAVRILRSAVHGFIQLESSGAFGMPDDVDASFERLLDVVGSGLPALGTVE